MFGRKKDKREDDRVISDADFHLRVLEISFEDIESGERPLDAYSMNSMEEEFNKVEANLVELDKRGLSSRNSYRMLIKEYTEFKEKFDAMAKKVTSMPITQATA